MTEIVLTVARQIKLVIPRQCEASSPESISWYAARWIPGSRLRRAPE